MVCFRLSFRLICPPSFSLPHWWYVGSGEPCQLGDRQGVVAYGMLATRPFAYGVLATRPVAYGVLVTRPLAVCRGRGGRITAVRGPLSVAIPGRHGDFVQYHPDHGGLDERERLERPA